MRRNKPGTNSRSGMPGLSAGNKRRKSFHDLLLNGFNPYEFCFVAHGISMEIRCKG
jgi:hypothetical protein